jgi:predicted kinase
MLVGHPGSGKSFYARQLCERLDLIRISHDEIRTTLFKDPTYDKYEDDIVTAISDMMVRNLLVTDKSIIVDTSVDTINERANRRLIAEKAGYKVIPIYIQTDIKTCIQRIKLRSKTKVDDRFHGKISRESFERRARRLQKPMETEHAITLSGKHTFSAQFASTMKKLSSYILMPDKEEVQKLSPSARISQFRPRGTTII